MSTPSRRPFQHPDNPPDVAVPPTAPDPADARRPEVTPLTFRSGQPDRDVKQPNAVDRPPRVS